MQEPCAGVQPITLASYFQYDAEGRLTVSQYPAATTISPNATFTYTTDHDALGRPSDLYTGTPQQPGWVVNSATYNAAGQLTAMSTGAYNESRQYNTNLQLARLTATPGSGQGIDFTYTYPGTGNNGRISQMTDNITGEQVSYTYDQLNRLVQAASTVTGHTMTFAYDGFGNLTQQGQTTLSIDPSTNRINSAGYQYNANGNVTQTPGPVSYAYDVANRLVSNGAIYNPRNQRVFDGTYLYLYTPEGKLAGKYTPAWSVYTSSNAFIQGGQPNVYFGGKLIQEAGQWVMTDRLGSVRLNLSGARSSYQPYGAEVAPTSDQRTKFATYYRDSAGLDYAGQRYCSNVTGRFLTADPLGMQAADPKNPTSWNLYAYVNGDPVNFNDPTGRLVAAPGIDCGSNWMWDASLSGPCAGGNYSDEDWGGGGGGGGGGDPCYADEFNPSPNPACYVPVPVPPPPSKPASQSCSYTVYGSGVGIGVYPAHTYVQLNEGNGSLKDYQAAPDPKAPADNPLHLPVYFGGSWLNESPNTGPLGGSVLYSVSGPQACATDAALDTAFNSWKSNTTSYYLPMQNSNSFTHWLLHTAGADPGLALDYAINVIAPGWLWYPSGQN